MAAPQARSWANLPTDCLHEIFYRVPCAADRHRAYRACTAWLNAAAEAPKLPPALPWLLLPAPRRDGAATRVVCVLSGYRVDHHLLLPFTTPGARYFGSHDGAWLFVHYRQTRRYELVNLRTGDVHGLPDVAMTRTNQGPSLLKVVIHAAALSSSPDDESCVAVSIATPDLPRDLRCVTLWLKGWPHAIQIPPPDVQISLFADDVIYHHGAFYLLHALGDHISVCKPQVLPDGTYTTTTMEDRYFNPEGRTRTRTYDQFFRSRYLVWSRGELLLVVRFTPHPNDQITSKFKVFRETERPQNPEADANTDFPVAMYPWAWSELDTLDGRILFVGHGCSRSYELKDAQGRIQYKGFKAGIYFLDDGGFYNLGNVVQYTSSDNGRWADDGRIQNCFPLAHPSCHSPPAWLLP